MSQAETSRDPPFRSIIRSSGLAEVWTHTHDKLKFDQFGWRCTTKENAYNNNTLIGNWDEERYDIEKQKIPQRLPSQHNHYFETTYGVAHNTQPRKVPESLKHLKMRYHNAFPHHQPELDTNTAKEINNSWETTTRVSYCDPRVRQQPLEPPAQTVQPVSLEKPTSPVKALSPVQPAPVTDMGQMQMGSAPEIPPQPALAGAPIEGSTPSLMDLYHQQQTLHRESPIQMTQPEKSFTQKKQVSFA
ncbi:UPF0686 protein C11orf1 homolog [Lingula anatina]|uniref:UPF0686 protein C11orf1 homolog n=1 Tax=Lingula anatina TaxID=7574 RepID=A0A1S3JPL9_LINAN|nr:UPF0686 protein C11orf1 homolog [Lingula anatina]|eukprot:XP_013412320.1 UPF0686 protein C11orf1 homolog [Lingula anatina]